jgi:hypothetical protein
MKRWAWLWLIISLAFSGARVLAQTTPPAAALTAVDSNNFPEIRAYLSVTDAAGQHIPGLPSSAFTLTENSAPARQLSIIEADLGTQVVFVLDVNAAFKPRNEAGVTRLDFLKEAINQFAQTMTDGDDVTLVAPEATLIAHTRSAQPVLDAVTRYESSFAGTNSQADLLSIGLNFAGDATPRPGMRRVLVVAANGLEANVPLEDLLMRAQLAQIQIHTVYVGSADGLELPSTANLRKLAAETGGQSVSLDNPGALGPIFNTILGQRQQYQLTYRSALIETGQHTLSARVQLPDGTPLSTAAFNFPLRVEPPLITLPNLPTTLEAGTLANFPLPVQITFPDGHVRSLREGQLLVNGQTVDIRKESTLTALTWPLGNYTESLTYTVQARVTDELGLTADTQPVEVFVNVPTLAVTASTASAPTSPEAPMALIIGGALAVAALLIGGGAFWWWRTQPAPGLPPELTSPTRPVRRKSTPGASTLPPKPRDIGDTIPVKTPLPPKRHKTLPKMPIPNFGRGPKALGKACLEIVESGGGGAPREAVQIFERPVKLGRDSALAEVIFEDKSVSRLHARIAEVEPGVFRIFDEGSTSGTWVNFTQINGDGQTLKSGDVINLGRVQLKFKLRE